MRVFCSKPLVVLNSRIGSEHFVSQTPWNNREMVTGDAKFEFQSSTVTACAVLKVTFWFSVKKSIALFVLFEGQTWDFPTHKEFRVSVSKQELKFMRQGGKTATHA